MFLLRIILNLVCSIVRKKNQDINTDLLIYKDINTDFLIYKCLQNSKLTALWKMEFDI